MARTVRFPERINTQVPAEVKIGVLSIAEKQGRTESEVVRAALAAYIRKESSR